VDWRFRAGKLAIPFPAFNRLFEKVMEIVRG